MRPMKLITQAQRQRLLRNGEIPDADPMPVVKLFTPDAGCTWLLASLDPEDPDLAFGLCDLGLGFPELGPVSLAELRALRGRLGLPVERDKGFEGRYPISVYAEAAWQAQRITTSEKDLQQAQAALAWRAP
jgi:Protein of unknown function (DUF2958)